MTRPAAELWTAWTTRRDERAFGDLVRTELPHALGFARRLGCSAADAEDALQDALTRLASVRDDAPAALGVRTWLCREVHTRARSRLRSERRRRTRESVVAADDARDASSPADVRDEVEHVLAALDADERTALELRYLHDLDYCEMAVVLGASEGACRQRVQKALAGLRARFGPDAAAVVAALPLPFVREEAALVRVALLKAAAPAAAGGAVMGATMTKLAIAAVVAVGAGAGAMFAAGRPDDPPAASADAALAQRDAEIARLKDRLADAERRPRGGRVPTGLTVGASGPAPATASGNTGAVGGGVTQSPAMSVVVKRGAPNALDVLNRAAPWIRAIRQTADPASRDAAWAEVRRALAGSDPLEVAAAIGAVLETSGVKIDRTGIRDLLLPLCDRIDQPTCLAAWGALAHTTIEPPDVAKLRGQVLAAEGEQRIELLHRLNWATKGVLEGADADVVLRVFEDETRRFDAVMAIQRARLSAAIVAKVLEYARTSSGAAEHAQQFVLRDLLDKDRAVVSFLLGRAEAGDLRAIEKLGGTVRADDVAFTGGRLRKLADARTSSLEIARIVAAIGTIGDTSSRDWLTSVRDDEKRTDAVRAAATQALEALDAARR